MYQGQHHSESGMDSHTLRVCYFGTYRAGYSRNRILIEGLRQCGVAVVECQVPLWRGVEDRVQTALGGWLQPAFLWRVLRAYARLLVKYRAIGDYDVMVLGYPGQTDVLIGRVLSWIRRRPLVLDAFMSIYLIASERGLTASHPASGRLVFWLEKLAYKLPNLLIKDTAQYAQWTHQTFGVGAGKIRLVPTGADDRLFRPHSASVPEAHDSTVLYYGTFIPNHGVHTIIQAAQLLQRDPGIHFELIGDGPTKAGAMEQARSLGLANVTFSGWVDREALPDRVARADLCLGAFGTTPQSMMTVHNKVFEGMALGKCVVTGDSPAMRDAFEHGTHIWLCKRDDAESLAEAIRTLKEDPHLREAIAGRGFQRYRQHYTTAALGQQFRTHLFQLLDSRQGH